VNDHNYNLPWQRVHCRFTVATRAHCRAAVQSVTSGVDGAHNTALHLISSAAVGCTTVPPCTSDVNASVALHGRLCLQQLPSPPFRSCPALSFPFNLRNLWSAVSSSCRLSNVSCPAHYLTTKKSSLGLSQRDRAMRCRLNSNLRLNEKKSHFKSHWPWNYLTSSKTERSDIDLQHYFLSFLSAAVTTLKVYVIACDLETSFSFDTTFDITDYAHVRLLCKYLVGLINMCLLSIFQRAYNLWIGFIISMELKWLLRSLKH